jgi:exodeoxyribonuclease VII large subunit
MDYISLKELASLIRSAVTEHTGEYWVVAEIASMNINKRSGHCYLELVEKDGERTVAQIKGTIWSSSFRFLRVFFREQTGSDLTPGMKVLFYGRPVFHEVYGLSLNITDIDPAYTLGEMALRRKETLNRLEKEGIIDRNRGLPAPIVPQRIAVISSSTAAGYGDFVSRIENNFYNLSFDVSLFEAYVQGEQAERSILKALARCKRKAKRFDIVVIIRGGGAQADLHCFDSYQLAREVALFPIPVLTGIGHERDETVIDRVSHRRLITPTAVADFITSQAKHFDDRIEELKTTLIHRTRQLLASLSGSLEVNTSMLLSASGSHLAEHKHRLSSTSKDFVHASIRLLTHMDNRIDRTASSLTLLTMHYLSRTNETLRNLDTKVTLLDPSNVLKRGYSITRFEGRALRDASVLKKGDIISTRLLKTSITSTVDSTEETQDGQ